MNIAQEMITDAIECLKTLGQTSVWSNRLGRYVCRDDRTFAQAVAERRKDDRPPDRPPLSAAFKLVFVTAAGGTLLFVLICVGTRLAMGAKIDSSTDEMLKALMDLVKIGFGTICGLLGGRALKE